MQTVNFKCGHCNNLMGVSAAFLGQQVRCPHCQQVVIAPAAMPQPAAPLPPPLPPPFPTSPPADDAASIFNENINSEDVFGQPPPRLEIPPPTFGDTTLPLQSRSAPASSPALDATMAYTPSPDPHPAAVAAMSAPAATPEVADWMNESRPDTPDLSKPARAPQRSSLGSMLFLTLVFMPLLLYAVLSTILIILLLVRSSSAPPDPREFLSDPDGDNPGIKKKTSRGPLQTDIKYATQPLPPHLRIKLGGSVTLGDLVVKAESVEWADVRMKTPGFEKAEERRVLRLNLTLKNVSKDVSFHPMDGMFDRYWDGKGNAPLTVLMAGERLRYFGGPAVWNHGPKSRTDNSTPRRYKVLGNNYDDILHPGAEISTFVCTNGFDPTASSDPYEAKLKELEQYKGPLLWHVHVRRGSVRWNDRDYPATAVIGVEFTHEDVK